MKYLISFGVIIFGVFVSVILAELVDMPDFAYIMGGAVACIAIGIAFKEEKED